MRQLDHRRARRLLDAFADGELDSARRARVLRHMVRCPACRAELAFTDLIRLTLARRRPT
ncbi:MAG: zf-HC2 domain-containing protein [Acidimicrobiales bacterium]